MIKQPTISSPALSSCISCPGKPWIVAAWSSTRFLYFQLQEQDMMHSPDPLSTAPWSKFSLPQNLKGSEKPDCREPDLGKTFLSSQTHFSFTSFQNPSWGLKRISYKIIALRITSIWYQLCLKYSINVKYLCSNTSLVAFTSKCMKELGNVCMYTCVYIYTEVYMQNIL